MKVKPSPNPGGVTAEPAGKDEAPLAKSLGTSTLRLQSILVPTDFSECARKALQYAVPFARQFHATLTLLHVVLPAYPTGELGTVPAPLPEVDAEAAGRTALADLAKKEIGEQVPTTTRVRVGRPADEIVAAARELGSDLIIIATHGHTGLRHVLLGSTTEHVVRRAPCPVLTVREHERDFVAPAAEG